MPVAEGAAPWKGGCGGLGRYRRLLWKTSCAEPRRGQPCQRCPAGIILRARPGEVHKITSCCIILWTFHSIRATITAQAFRGDSRADRSRFSQGGLMERHRHQQASQWKIRPAGGHRGLFERVFDAWLSLTGRAHHRGQPGALAFFDLRRGPDRPVHLGAAPHRPRHALQPEFLRALSEGQPVHYESPPAWPTAGRDPGLPDGDGLVLHFRDISLRKFNELALTEGTSSCAPRSTITEPTCGWTTAGRCWTATGWPPPTYSASARGAARRGLWDLRPDLLGSETFRQAHRAAATGLPLRFEDRWGETWYEVLAYPVTAGGPVPAQHRRAQALRAQHRFLAALGEALMAAAGRCRRRETAAAWESTWA